MAYDPVHKVVVLHGGYDQQTNWANDTWYWNGTQWLLQSPSNSPPANGYVREQPICWDGQKGAVLLVNEEGDLANVQTWSWDGSAWSRVSDTGAPSLGTVGYQPMAIAYDSARHVTAMFSQVNGVPTTWTFDETKWTQVAASGTQAMSFAIAADDANSTMVMFGSVGDTWTWDGSKWTLQHPQHSPPSGGIYTMAYDPVRHLVAMLTGAAPGVQTWTWNGSDWTPAD